MPANNQPLQGAQPHLAIVLLWYPLFTQPFIFREVEGLSHIMPLEVYTLYDLNLKHCSREMRLAAGRAHVYGAKSILSLCMQATVSFFCHPVILGKLFARHLFYKWPNWETFGENLWGFLVGISLGRRFKEEGIDFVYSPWPRGAATAASVGAALAGIPYAVAARGDNLNPADPDLANKLAAAILIRSNNAADKKRIEQFASGVGKDKTELVYNSLTLPPVSFCRLKPKEKKGAALLALGRFDVTKGFDILLSACRILKDRGITFHLTLAGGGGKIMGLGHLGHKLAQMRSQLELENEVDMPGLISHDELPQLLVEHDIFVAPCVVHKSGRRDGIPNTVIEAMAYGLPVVSTNINAMPEVIKNNITGLMVEPGDPVALADALQNLINDSEKARELGTNAAALASNMFDPSLNAVRLANMFRNAYKNLQIKPCAE